MTRNVARRVRRERTHGLPEVQPELAEHFRTLADAWDVQWFGEDEKSALTSATVNHVSSLAYGNGQFVAVGNTNNTALIITSADEINGVQRFSSTSPLQLTGVAYGNGRFVAIELGCRMVVTSTDGINWVLDR
jgi:hypothetical protein